MSYLKFEKALMTNLQESLPKELLRTNRSGAYSCSTIVDCNTRKYHGLLVVPIPELDDDNHVLLSSLDVTVIQHGAEFNLGLHKYQGNNYNPMGHKYIREFDCDKVPTTLYRVGGVILKKEVVFQHYENRILLRYTLVDGHSATTLRFRPFLAFRSVRQFTHENATASRDYAEVDNGIKTCMYAGYPDLFMQFSKKNNFVFQPDWYRGVEYPKEQERGYASNEDLYVPGYFEMNIKKGETIVFAASTSEIKSRSLKALFDKEVNERAPRDNFFHCLVNAAHQFHRRESNDDRYIIAGYPWFKCRARDTFISLPGLTLSIEEDDYFELVMKTAMKGYYEFMEGKPTEAESLDEIIPKAVEENQYKYYNSDGEIAKTVKIGTSYISEGTKTVKFYLVKDGATSKKDEEQVYIEVEPSLIGAGELSLPEITLEKKYSIRYTVGGIQLDSHKKTGGYGNEPNNGTLSITKNEDGSYDIFLEVTNKYKNNYTSDGGDNTKIVLHYVGTFEKY